MNPRKFFSSLVICTLLLASLPISSLSRVEAAPDLKGPGKLSGSEADLETDDVEPLPEDVSTDWWAAVQENLRRSEYHVTWQDHTYLPDVGAAYQAPNRAHNLRTYFTSEGPVVIPRVWSEGAEALPWRWGLRLVAWGREGALQSPGAAIVHADANRVEYRYGGRPEIPNSKFQIPKRKSRVVEWYVNDERGLEQGFRLAAAPKAPILPSNSKSQVILELALSGDLSPRLADGGTAVEFFSPGGVRVLRYSDLHATDATGRQLPTYLELTQPRTTHYATRNTFHVSRFTSHVSRFTSHVLHLIVDDSSAVYPITVDPIATTPNWTAEGDQGDARFGVSVGTAGDVNGDGYDDVIVGAYNYDGGDGRGGAAFVYHGSGCGLSTAADWMAASDESGARFGYSVGTAGDVNGDGYDDVIIGAYWYEDIYAESAEGWAFVWHGSGAGLGADGTPGNADWSAQSNQGNAYFGYSVGTAGDVNDDGYDDVIVGAYMYTNGQSEEGAAFIWYGSGAGLGADGTPGNADWTKEGGLSDAWFGYSVGTAGDVNDDGYADVIVGAPRYSHTEGYEGLAFVYTGSGSGPTSAPHWHAESNQEAAYFGYSVGTAGDVNGDGYSDVIVGALYYDHADEENRGAAFVWYGSDTGLGDDGHPDNDDWAVLGDGHGDYLGSSVGTAGDVDGDGYDDVIVAAVDYSNSTTWAVGAAFVFRGSASGLLTLAIWSVEGDERQERLGGSVGTAGDVNGDGCADVIVGTPEYDSGAWSKNGRADVYYGSASGPSPDWIKESDKANAHFGISAATAGDVNGDGYADLIVGAPGYDYGGTGDGAAFVYRGSTSGPNPVPYWHAHSPGSFGSSVATAGDVNGDGYADVIVGAPGYSHGSSGEGAAFVWHGSASGLGDTGTPANADWTAEADRSDTFLGRSVATAGDVNGDGYADVIIGADYYYLGWAYGAVYVWHGSASGLGADGTPANADWAAESDQFDAYFGYSVGTAGDVNGDGYADIIVGADQYSNGETWEGAAFVWYGSVWGLGPDGTLYNADWSAEGDQQYTGFGRSVGTAGDVNGDGCADVIVGAYLYGMAGWEGHEGAAFVWHGSASGLGDDGTPGNADWHAEGDQGDPHFGISVGTAGDVNGDGYADVIVGADDYDYGYAGGGAAFVYHGSLSGLGASPWAVQGDQDEAQFGISVATAGDVNGDGYADVIAGAPDYDHGQVNEGRAFVWYGSAFGLDPAPYWTVESNQATAHFGTAVATAGDVNGDGYADVIVGADDYDGGQAQEGAAFVYHGSEFGLYLVASWSAEGEQEYAHFGRAVGTAGDVNGDGYADVIVGAPDYDDGQDKEGRAFVWCGSAAGLGDDGTPTNADWRAEGDQAEAYFGRAVGTAGDVNGDGYADVIVGAYGYDHGENNEGRAFVWHGSDAGLGASGTPVNADWRAESNQEMAYFGYSAGTAGDVNGDGCADVIVGAYLYTDSEMYEGRAFAWYGSPTGLGADGTPDNADWSAEGGQEHAHLGRSVGTAGDVNGDGYADVIVGAPDYTAGQDSEGVAFAYGGSSSGLREFWGWAAAGDQEYAHFGRSVGTAGDVNGDGYADVIVGAYKYDRCYRDEGGVYVYHGIGSGLSWSPNWTAWGDQEYAYFGTSVGTAGDVNGDGYAEVIVGADYYDAGQANEGQALVYYGDGGLGRSLRPRQRRSDDSGPIAPLGLSGGNSFRLALRGRTPFGRGKVKLEWEVKPLGTPFDGTGTGQSGTWMDTGQSGVDISELVSDLSAGTAYHWRVRLCYHPATTPFQQHSRWLTVPWNGWNEADLRTGPEVDEYFVYLPAVLKE